MKKALKNLLSVVLCVAIMLSCLFVVSGADIKVNAYYEPDSFTTGETYNFYLTEYNKAIAYFRPQKSGFYKFTITDHTQNGLIGMWINGSDRNGNSEYFDYNPDEIIDSYTSSYLYMLSGYEYLVNFLYFDANTDNVKYGANISIKFEEVDFVPPVIPAQFGDVTYNKADGRQYYSFTTTEAGDYTLYYQSLYAVIDVYNADKGIWEEHNRATEIWAGDDMGYLGGVKTVFRLEANTTYYFRIECWMSFAPTPLAMSKNEKTVSSILAHSADKPISCWMGGMDIAYNLNYKISYTDNTYEYMNSIELQTAGYSFPEVTLDAKTVEAGSFWFYAKSLRTPIHSKYDNNNKNTIYVEVLSFTDELIEAGETAIDEFSVGTFENTSDYVQAAKFQRIKVLETGIYYIWPDERSSWIDLDYLDPVILDSNNNIVTYNEDEESWALIGGQEYVMIAEYSFSYHSDYNDFSYELVRDRKNIFPDAASGQWYSDPIAYAYSTGIMKGYANGMFGTSDGIQRQDFLLMLARYSNVSPYSYAYSNLGGFTDLDSYAQYAYAVNWGYEKGIVTGYENGKFGVGDKITREQLVTFLYRYANYKGLDMTVTAKGEAKAKAYPDFALVSDFAEDAVIWAIDRGIINGKSGKIEPQGTAQRCEIAQIMYNIHTKNIF